MDTREHRRRALALALCAALAAACAAPPAPPTPVAAVPTPAATPSPGPATPPPATVRPTTKPAATPTPAPRPLRLWLADDERAAAALGALLGAGQPEVTISRKDADTLRLGVLSAGLAGEPPPDLIWADQEALAGLLADGALQPVEPPADLLPALRAAATADGQLWGLPITAQGALLLLYNRRLANGPPATSDELIARSRAGDGGLTMAWDEPRWLLPWLYGFGGAPTGPDGAAPTLDTPEMRAALGLLRELYVAAPADIATYRGGQRAFGRGELAFAVDGDWSLAEYRTLTETLDLGIAALPLVPSTGRPAAPPLGGSFLMLARGLAGADLDRARAVLALLADPAAQAQIAAATGRLPAAPAALDSPAIGADPALAAAVALALRSPGLPPTRAARCALFGIDVWLPSLLGGALDQDETAVAMQREAEACVTP